MRVIILFTTFFIAAISGSAAEIHVPDDYGTIQAAIDAASPLDTVLVGPGTYVENVVISKYVHLISTDGPDLTVIDASNPQDPDYGSAVSYHSVHIYPDIVLLDGFTLTKGTGTYDTCVPDSTGAEVAGYYGGGLHVSQSGFVLCRNCVISGNTACAGGGVAGISAQIMMENCLVRENSATSYSGGGILLSKGVGFIQYCQVLNNTSIKNGIGLMSYDFTHLSLQCCLFAGNKESAQFAIWIEEGDATFIECCTLTNNYNGIVISGGSIKFITNTILWDNDLHGGWDGDEVLILNQPGNSKIIHCDIEDGMDSVIDHPGAVIELMAVDPMFEDPANHDYRLSYNSPLIDKGTHSYIYDHPETDFEGDPRKYDGDFNGTEIMDIGCDEYTLPKEVWVDDDWIGYGHGDEVEGHVFGVTAFNIIQEAIDTTYDFAKVNVADGTYVGAGNRDIDFLGKEINLASQSGAETCIIDCEAAGRGFVFQNEEDENSVVDGFTITNGYSEESGGGMFIESASPTVRNCRFIDNAGFGGGGISTNYSGSMIEDCLFEGNSLSITPTILGGGGGMSNLSQPGDPSPSLHRCTFLNNVSGLDGGALHNLWTTTELLDCRFEGNHADRNGGGVCSFGMMNVYDATRLINCTFHDNTADQEGGGMSLFNDAPAPTASPELINCTFSGNTATLTGGALHNKDSDPAIINCIFWGNGPDEVTDGGTLATQMTYCCVEGGFPGIGNIDTDPMFMDQASGDLHLTHPSPCKNTGTSSPPMITDTDFEGDPRIADGSVDMGADEFHSHLYFTGDATPGGTIALKSVGEPGDIVRLWVSAGIMDPPLQHPKFGNWYLEFPVLLGMVLGPIPSPEGVMVLPIAIPLDNPVCDIPMQAGLGLHLSNLCVLNVR